MNQQYIQMKSNEDLKKLIRDFYPKSAELDTEMMDALMPLLKTRMEILKDFEKSTKMFFGVHEYTLSAEEKELAKELQKNLVEISSWNHAMIFETMKKIMGEKSVRMPVLYKIFTGEERGLPLPESLEIFGKERTLNLLDRISK
jgi:lysyl-tRNA synthetase class I